MDKNLNFEITEIANTKITSLINYFKNITSDTAKMIRRLCTEDDTYIKIFRNIYNIIEHKIDTSVIEQVAKNMLCDVQKINIEINNR